MAFGSLLGILGILAFVWIIYDIFTNQKSMDNGKKALWIILGLFFSIITAIIYYFVVKKK